ncbi:MAG TPA: response regulator, partial [Allocoleopsis sp.]
LLIDDNLVARYLFKQLLVDTQCNIIEAANGGEGIRLARSENPACIVLDLVMPEMSGIEVLDQLKSDPATRHIPVIINTSKWLDEQERNYLANQTIAILSKESASQEVAFATLRDALILAGLILEDCGKGHG